MTLIAVYAASTLSHIPFGPRLTDLFRRLDQGSIYLLIVGTCMPLPWSTCVPDGGSCSLA